MIKTLSIKGGRQGLHEISSAVAAVVDESQCKNGLCTLFVKHTSASLIIQENADPSAKRDLEAWLNRLVKEDDPLYTHTLEGADDMPAHIKSVLTSCSLSIPITNHRLALGTWQGIYLWEHRHQGGTREIVCHIAN